MRVGPAIADRWQDMEAAWHPVLENGNIKELADKVQELGVENAWSAHTDAVHAQERHHAHSVCMVAQEGIVQDTQTKLHSTLSKERERDGRKRRRDLAEDA
eukprot:gene55288-20877_t